MRTNVYVDGFNLYYGALRGTPYKWLDIRRMCELLLKKHTVERIAYFTARVSARSHDPLPPLRQQAYLRAIRTLPNTSIVFGHFLTNEVYMPIAGCAPGKQQYVKVIKTEEKGSDVNIASHLLRDAFRGEAEAFALVTNDSDLVEPVRIVREELALPVGILNPHRRPSQALRRVASFVKPIRKGVLGASQLPATIGSGTTTTAAFMTCTST